MNIRETSKLAHDIYSKVEESKFMGEDVLSGLNANELKTVMTVLKFFHGDIPLNFRPCS